ncbi:MAG TPA: ABC transporter ATP-binding protein [Firmicutes bacterium]|nr:ABC transporter ATP-binding protein [Bacillota bacterium]
MNVIEVVGLSKNYGSLQAVRQVSFRVAEGMIFGILGPNGAGKTTTMECMIGLRNRTEGSITVLGLDPEKHRHELFNDVGVQLQETVYQSQAKVFELCELFTAMYEKPLNYKELLERFDLSGKIKSTVGSLSGGQRQKLAIVLALVSNPRLVFLDELTTGLDPSARREIWTYIKELQDEGRTIVMTTHYMEEAALLCDEICLFNQGEIVAQGTVDEVIAQADIDLVISFETDGDVANILEGLPRARHIEHDGRLVNIYTNTEQTLTDLILRLNEGGIVYRRIKITYPELEDAFLKLVNSTTKGAVS